MISIISEKGIVQYEPNPDNIVRATKILQNIRLNITQTRRFLFEGQRERIVETIGRRRDYLKGF